MSLLHSTAVVHEEARLEPDVTVGPFAVIEADVEVAAGAVIGAHAVLKAGTRLGARVQVGEHAVIAGLPQDLHFDPGTPSAVVVGEGAVLREGVTIHRATQRDGATQIGAGAFLMAYAHVAHDAQVGAHAVLANNVMLGGFAEVGPHAFLGGGVAIHQHGRVGESTILSGLSRFSEDIGPFLMGAERNRVVGVNLVGLKRREFSAEAITDLKRLFAELFHKVGGVREKATHLLAKGAAETEAGERFLIFYTRGERNYAKVDRKR